MPLVALAPASGSQDIDRYELLFRFAAGGMAEVFVARQRGEGGFLRPIAVKRMLPALAEEPRFVEMFLDEARLAALVQSPYVVPTLDCGKDEEGSPYIVMELVVGVSLSQALRGSVERKTPVPPAIMAEIIAQTALGLYDAHHARTPTGQPLEIVHRDVSPQNVLIGVDGRARLTDFGVARALERVSRTSTGEVKGKLSYFSPEQARMESVDQRSDIFALGVVAWETLTLERLFSRDNPIASLQAVLHERIPDVRESNPDLPEKLALAVAKALERDLSTRYQTAREFADDLRAAVGTPATATQIGEWIELSGGPRLAAFRKRIESAFGEAADTAVRTSKPASGRLARDSQPPSSSQRALYAQGTPVSYVVGEARTAPDEKRVEGTATAVVSTGEPSTRVVAVKADALAKNPEELSIAVDLASVVAAPRAEAEAAPAASRPIALVAAVAVLFFGIAAAAYYLGGDLVAAPTGEPAEPSATIAEPVPAAPIAAPPATAVVEPEPVVATPAEPIVPAVPTTTARPTDRPRDRTVTRPTTPETPVVTEAVIDEPRPPADPPPPAETETAPETVTPPPETGRLRVGTGAGRLRGATP